MRHIVAIIIFTLFSTATLAQDERTNLIDMLGTVPDQPEIHDSMINYSDFRAMVTAREGAVTPSSILDILQGKLSDELNHYGTALVSMLGTPSFARSVLADGSWENTVGFDFVTIERTIEYRTLPEPGAVAVGDFDMDAVSAAFTARDYMAEPIGDFMLWCSANGCEIDLAGDEDKKDLSNPFGGLLGREEPVLISDKMFISSPILSQIETTYDAVTGEIPSLADNESYMTAVNALQPSLILIQATFVPPSLIMGETTGDVSDLPPYQLVLIADGASDREQIVSVILVYDTLEDAETAINVIPSRLDTMISSKHQLIFRDVFNDYYVELLEIRTSASYDETTDLAAAIIEFHALDAAARDPESLGGEIIARQVYRRIYRMVTQQDIGWLVTDGTNS